MKTDAKTFFITGGAKRLGALCARELAKKGHHLVLHFQNSLEAAENLQKELEVHGGRVSLIQASFNEPDEVRSLCETVEKKYGPIHGIINNASTFTRGSLDDGEHFDVMMKVHVFAVRAICSYFAKTNHLEQIINFIDALIEPYNHRYQNYRLSKLFLSELTRQLALSFAPKIRVNAIAPGPILPAENDNGEIFQEVVLKTPLQFSPGPEGIVHALHYLLEANYLTGQIIYVDSGQHLL